MNGSQTLQNELKSGEENARLMLGPQKAGLIMDY